MHVFQLRVGSSLIKLKQGKNFSNKQTKQTKLTNQKQKQQKTYPKPHKLSNDPQ